MHSAPLSRPAHPAPRAVTPPGFLRSLLRHPRRFVSGVAALGMVALALGAGGARAQTSPNLTSIEAIAATTTPVR
jgi:hypothetical protein